MKTICYLRVSSAKNGSGHSRQSTGSQKNAIKTYLQAHKIKNPVWLEDFASGKEQTKRPAFQQMMELCRQGEVERVIVWRLDRLGRSLSDNIKCLTEIQSLKIELVVINEGIKLDQSPLSQFTFNILSSLSQLESSIISERVRAGLAVAKLTKKLGPPPKTEQRNKIKRWRDRGWSVKRISLRLGVSTQAIYAMLNNKNVA